jgi:hypothetical protein
MAKTIHIQVRGVEAPLLIKADKVDVPTMASPEPKTLKLTLEGKSVGEFKDAFVDGWWITE